MYIGLTHILFDGIVVEIKKINQYSKKFMVNVSHCLTLLSVKNTHPKLNLLDNMSLFLFLIVQSRIWRRGDFMEI